jgi:hypothetical protein
LHSGEIKTETKVDAANPGLSREGNPGNPENVKEVGSLLVYRIAKVDSGSIVSIDLPNDFNFENDFYILALNFRLQKTI